MMSSARPPASVAVPSRIPSAFWRWRHPLDGAIPLNLFPQSFYRDGFGRMPIDGGRTMWILNTPAAIRRVLVTHVASYPKEERAKTLLEAVFGDSIFSAEGDAWRRKRRLAAPSFRREPLMASMQIFSAEASTLAERWLAADGPVSLGAGFKALQTRILGRALLGGEYLAQSDAIVDVIASTMSRFNVATFLLKQMPRAISLPMLKRLAASPNARLDRIADSIFAARRAANDPAAGRRDLLQQWIAEAEADEQPLTATDLRNELSAMYFAGNETVSITLTWLFYLLSISPDVRARLQSELDAVLAGRPLGPDDLDRLPFTRAVINETLRLYPAIPVQTARVATIDAEVAPGVTPRIGDLLIIAPYVLHRHEEHWREPAHFRPDRFLSTDHRKTSVFMPFGSGPRVCIGQSLAEIELITVTATLAQTLHLDVLQADRVAPRPHFLLAPRNAIMAKASRS